MGSTNHGTQTVSHKFYEEVTANNRNVRLVDIIPRGIYSGGYLTKVSDLEVQLGALTAEIGDSNVQVKVETAAAATINDSTLDSGSISPLTPYLVLRWGYAATQINYMEIHAVASVASAQTNDLIIGKIVFSGSTISAFDYSERSMLNVQNLSLKPTVSETSELYIRIRAGVVHSATGYHIAPEQKVGPFAVPAAPNSRIDLVYVGDDGVAQIVQGVAAVSPSAPSYAGRRVVAEVTIANGAASIVAANIKDVRSFVTPREVPDDSITVSKLKSYESEWFPIGLSTTYTKPHGLSAEPKIVLCYIAENADGSGRRTGANGSALFVHDNYNVYAYGTSICKVDATNVKIRTGIQSVAIIRDENGSVWVPTTAYAKIIAIE